MNRVRKAGGHRRPDCPLGHQPWVCVEREHELQRFELIVPCGITDRKGVTSLERLLGRTVLMREAEEAAIAAMASVFERTAVGAHSAATFGR